MELIAKTVLLPLLLLAVFYWPGRVLLRLITGGRYPPPGRKAHNIELVALAGLAIFLVALSIAYA